MAVRAQSVRCFFKHVTNAMNRYSVPLLKNIEQSSINISGPKAIVRCFSVVNISSPVSCRSSHWNGSLISERSYSKGKEKGDKKKKGPVTINEQEIEELVNVQHLKNDLQKGIDHLKNDYIKHLSLRSTSGSIESLPVEFEGDTYTLQEIAQIGRKGPQLLVVNLSGFPQAVKNVLKAINDSGMGLNPQQDGTTIFISVPKVTREYRESLAKNAKALFQKFKDHSRDIQNRYIREVKKKEKEVSSDLAHSVQQQIHTLTEQFVSEAEKIMIAKQNELLGKD